MDFVNELISQHGLIPVIASAGVILLLGYSIVKGGSSKGGNGNGSGGSSGGSKPPTPPTSNS